MGFCNIQSWDVIDGVCFTYHPDALTYIVPQWHPVSAWSNSPTQLPPTECAETSSSSQTHKTKQQTQWNDFWTACVHVSPSLVHVLRHERVGWLCWVGKQVSQSDCIHSELKEIVYAVHDMFFSLGITWYILFIILLCCVILAYGPTSVTRWLVPHAWRVVIERIQLVPK